MSAGFYACDSTTAPEDKLREAPTVNFFNVSPSEVQFISEHGFKDTTLSISVEARFDNHEYLDNPFITISDKSSAEIIEEQSLELVDSITNTYAVDFNISTTTTSIEDFIINMIYDAKQGNYAQKVLKIRGFSNFPPEILETDSPEVINRPESGSIPAIFTAKVTDEDGQENISRVYLRVINQQSGEVEGSPFEMFDNGETYDDETANDSTYTWYQSVPPNEENPNSDFDIEFFAMDKGGLSSDTVRTTFSIRE